MIVTTVTSHDFHNAFNAMRPDQFSYDALEGLFNFFEEMSEDSGTPYELDVPELVRDFTEYADLEELMGNYDSIESLEDLHDNTLVLELDNGGLVIQNF